MKTPHVLRLEAVTNLVANREELSDEQLLALLCSALGIETLGQKRARAGRSGGLRSVESRREVSGSAQPKQVPKQTRSRPPDASEAKPEATPKQPRSNPQLASMVASEANPPSLVSPSHSPSDSLPPAVAKEIAVVSEGSDRFPARTTATTAPRNHEEALTEPAGYVAGLCRDAMMADLLAAHRLPWVVEVLTAWHEARGGQGDPKIGIPSRDGGVRAVLELFAMGYGKNDLVRVARHLPSSDKFRDKVSASIMTPDVVAIALGELNERRGAGPTSFARDLVRRVDSSSRAPSPLGAVLPRLASGDGE